LKSCFWTLMSCNRTNQHLHCLRPLNKENSDSCAFGSQIYQNSNNLKTSSPRLSNFISSLLMQLLHNCKHLITQFVSQRSE
jgi:hypothetical protein